MARRQPTDYTRGVLAFARFARFARVRAAVVALVCALLAPGVGTARAAGAAVAPAVAPPPVSAAVAPPSAPQWREVGRSVQGRPLRAITVGTGARRVLWIGGIHGDETEGVLATAELLRTVAEDPVLTASVTLTVLEDANPDGRAARRRTNANGVDLNRNFPAANFDPSPPEHGGFPLSQPESRAVDALIDAVHPELIVVMHSWLGRQFVTSDGPAADLVSRFTAKSGMTYEYLDPSTYEGGLGLYASERWGLPVIVVEFARGLDQGAAWRLIQAAALDVVTRQAEGSGGAVAVNRDGRFEAFGITPGASSGTLVNSFQQQVGQGWDGWYPHSGAWPVTAAFTTIRGDDGRLVVVATREDGVLQITHQGLPGQGWLAPQALGADIVSPPAIARNLDGRLVVAAIGTDGQLRHRTNTAPGGGWSSWVVAGGSFTGAAPAIGTTADGRLIVVAVAADRTVAAMAQTSPGGGWTPLVTILGSTTSVDTPAIGRNDDGRLELVVASHDGVLRHAWQEGFGWSTLVPLTVVPATTMRPALTRNPDGRLEVAFVAADQRLHHVWQEAAGRDWSDAVALGDRHMVGPPSIATNSDGRIEVFTVGDDASLWHAFQEWPNGAWSGLSSLGGTLSP